MDKVAHHLQVEAVKRDKTERDIFARSAYNRYYYAAFLAVRDMLVELDPTSWSELAHKSYPEILMGQITTRCKQARTRARKNNDQNLMSQLDSAIRAAAALASLMTKANGVRVVADYKPSETVVFTSNDRFSLKGIQITEAHSWGSRVALWIKDIKQAWMQIDV